MNRRRPMFTAFLQLLLFLGLLGVSGCSTFEGAESKAPSSVHVGSRYYTQFTFQYEKNRFRTTNYRRGTVVPVNTEVELDGWGSEGFKIRLLPSGTEIEVLNVEEYTGDTVDQAFSKMFSQHPVDLNRFTEQERRKIMAGRVIPRMDKKAVIAPLGYPPLVGTASLDESRWTYWSGRMCKFVISFKDDKVEDIIPR